MKNRAVALFLLLGFAAFAAGCARTSEPTERLAPETREIPASGAISTATATSAAAPPSALGVNVAAGRPVIERGGGVDWETSIDEVDFNTTTNPEEGGWLNQTNYGTYQVVDLGRVYLLRGVGYDLMWDGAYVNSLTFVVEVSTDGQTWKEVSRIVHPYTATEGSNFVDVEIPIDEVDARYVRYSEPEDGEWNGWGSIYQLRAYALASPPTTIPAVSLLPPTASPIPPAPVIAVRPTEDELWALPSLWNYFNLASGLDPSVPGSREWAVALDVDSPLTWPFFWCASDRERLADNLSTMSVQFSIDGAEVPADSILELDIETGEESCHYWATLLTRWENGSEASLAVDLTLDEPVNDGRREYAAGNYSYVIVVNISY
jgi:hypothetical protein